MFDTSNQLEDGPAVQTLPLTAPALNDAPSREHPGITRLASHAAGGPRMNEQIAAPAPNRCRKSKRITMGYVPTSKPGVELPCLKLRGRWLREAGFAIGQKLKVEVNEGRLMIEAVD